MTPVPTCAELAKMGPNLCYEVLRTSGSGRKKRTEKFWHVTDAGHTLLGQIMRANAAEAVARGDGEWTRPPSSGQERNHS